MARAIIFDVDGTPAETEETHRQAVNRAFRKAGSSWQRDQGLYRKLLGVTGVCLRVLKEPDLPDRACVAIEDSRNGLLSARAANITTIITPGIYTRDEDFDEAALVVDSLELVDYRAIEALFL